MFLRDLLADSSFTIVAGPGDVRLLDLTDDSRLVKPGSGFVARPGAREDGRKYIADAINRGAAAILTDGSPGDLGVAPGSDQGLAWATKPGLDQADLSRLAERFFGFPSRQLTVFGITGTKGKTTTAYLVQHLATQAGLRCGMVGTVVIDDGQSRQPANLTTPGPLEFSRLLAAMVRNGCGAVVAEVSSHALHQGRVAGIDFDAGIFTNLTGDHLDYHGTMEAYAAAKAMLFAHLKPTGYAVVNIDDAWASQMVAAFNGPESNLFTCTLDEGRSARCRATVTGLGARSSDAVFEGPWGRCAVSLPLVGRHNVANALHAAAAVCAATDLGPRLAGALARSPSVPGRLEPVAPANRRPSAPTVLVDYAHTHDSLEKVLTALQPLTRGRLHCLFGCGGDRDRTKRPKMAQVACRLADRVILTSDNPRTEDPARIIDDVLAGVPAGMGSRLTVEPDRARAIELAILGAGADDVVILAGKGHEDYQIIGTQKRHFDDREEAARVLTMALSPSDAAAAQASGR